MLPHRSSIVIIGGGIIGSAIFANLAKSYPNSVALLEKNKVAAGATGWSAGIVRRWPHADEGSPLRRYQELLCHNLGCTPTLAPTLHFSLSPESLCRHAMPAEGRTYASSSYTSINHNEIIALEPDTGFYDPVETTRALVSIGCANGGLMFEGITALSLVLKGGVVMGVNTDHGTIQSRIIVLATGAWIEQMSHDWDLGLPIVARTIQMYRLKSANKSEPLPIFIDGVLDIYGRGDGSDSTLVGMPVSAQGRINPDRPQPAHKNHSEQTIAQARRRFPYLASATVQSTITGCDGYTSNGIPLVQQHPHIRSLYVAAGFSGGGFKQAPHVARTIAGLINNQGGSGYEC
jgi:sarcosine oxidase subunit beta